MLESQRLAARVRKNAHDSSARIEHLNDPKRRITDMHPAGPVNGDPLGSVELPEFNAPVPDPADPAIRMDEPPDAGPDDLGDVRIPVTTETDHERPLQLTACPSGSARHIYVTRSVVAYEQAMVVVVHDAGSCAVRCDRNIGGITCPGTFGKLDRLDEFALS